MPGQILLKRAQGARDTLLLDTASGRSAPAATPPGARTHGTLASIEGQTFALYADQDALWLQWNERRWPLAGVTLKYGHDLDAATTTFTADDRSLTYPAWWRGDPAYEPLIPEEDEVQDWLAYVAAVKADPALQARLLESWA